MMVDASMNVLRIVSLKMVYASCAVNSLMVVKGVIVQQSASLAHKDGTCITAFVAATKTTTSKTTNASYAMIRTKIAFHATYLNASPATETPLVPIHAGNALTTHQPAKNVFRNMIAKSAKHPSSCRM